MSTVSPFPERYPVTGNDDGSALPVTAPPMSVTGNTLWTDVASVLDGDGFTAPAPTILRRTDGNGVFYTAQANVVVGDPESGKTWIASAAVVESLCLGGRAVVLDLDHNGPHSTISRLLDMGAPESALRDPTRFRYTEPEDGAHLVAAVRDAVKWEPDVVVLDSLGEVIPLFGGSSNSPDDFTRVHALVIKPLTMAGACVIIIDHLAKNAESRAMGATGTAAKKRAVGGVMLRVTVADAFTPGRGGAAHLAIAKDRHGGLRAVSPTGDKEPLAGTFRLVSEADGTLSWAVHAPAGGDRNPAEAADPADVAALAELNPPPTSVRDARERMGWRMDRAAAAMRDFRALPVTHTGGTETGNTCPEHGTPSPHGLGCALCAAQQQGVTL
jgi:hypothetical protein